MSPGCIIKCSELLSGVISSSAMATLPHEDAVAAVMGRAVTKMLHVGFQIRVKCQLVPAVKYFFLRLCDALQ